MKCIKPNKHFPQFESKHNCKTCTANELKRIWVTTFPPPTLQDMLYGGNPND